MIDSNDLLGFEIIVCEIHWLDKLIEPVFFEGVTKTIEKLSLNHTPVHLHINNYGGDLIMINSVKIPRVVELSFLRNDCEEFDDLSQEKIPSDLDYPNNPYLPDICHFSVHKKIK